MDKKPTREDKRQRGEEHTQTNRNENRWKNIHSQTIPVPVHSTRSSQTGSPSLSGVYGTTPKYGTPPSYPISLHATSAAAVVKPWSHTEPHRPSWNTSRMPEPG